jgi:membrane protein YqaA with SNARE-associated domain
VVVPAFAGVPAAVELVPDAALALQTVASTVSSLPAGFDAAAATGGDAGATTGEVLSRVGVREGTVNGTATGGPTEGGSGGWLDFSWIQTAVETATGWVGLGIIAVYSFLIAFVLPLPSEVVLFAPLDVGFPWWSELGLIILVSGLGKAAGSVFAFHLGQEAKEAGPIIRFLRRSRFDVVEWSERQSVAIARKYGYAGLAMALCVPGFPDTISIYAFSILEEDYVKFALATFAGSVGRLVLWEAGFNAITIFI